ncbi:TadE family protein [Desulfolutivibrio sulfoxidireducens]|uniref:TadE family protein n=1 Tax=Desulfolutivibrio sulfoxidireducens TaxID=2773299 RepID=UPI003F604134
MEMALLLPVFLTVVFGIIDYGRFFFIRAAVTAAVADAARTAVLPAATDEQITRIVETALRDPITTGTGGQVAVSVAPETRTPGTVVTVTATMPFTPLVLPGFLGTQLFPQNVAASAAMTVEP